MKQRTSESWQATPRRQKILAAITFAGGFGFLTWAQDKGVRDSGLSTLFVVSGIALIGAGFFLLYGKNNKAAE